MFMKIALGTWPFGVFAEASPIEFDTVLDRAAQLGFDGIEFAAMPPHPGPISIARFEERKELMARISSRGLEVSAVVTFSDGTIISEAKPTKYLADFDATLKFCTDLGVTRMWVCTGDAPDIVIKVGYRTALDRLTRTWSECARRADAVGVTLVWEFEIGSAFNELSQVVEVAHALTGPGFGVLYDTAHAHLICEVSKMETEGKAPGDGQIELLRQLNGTIAHVHLGDSGGGWLPSPQSRQATSERIELQPSTFH